MFLRFKRVGSLRAVECGEEDLDLERDRDLEFDLDEVFLRGVLSGDPRLGDAECDLDRDLEPLDQKLDVDDGDPDLDLRCFPLAKGMATDPCPLGGFLAYITF